ncbi:MAG: hypothetical protein OXJ53_06155 [Gammaproteobacteria bacterium]|nr:hypothetical protein [Gammaproteobacteria bacterium]
MSLLATHSQTAWTAEQSDIERAERIQTIRDLARTIFERSHERATDAVNLTAIGKENNQRMAELVKACSDVSIARIEAATEALEQGKSTGHFDSNNELARATECIRDATSSNPNADVIADLREEFIEEELEALRDSMEEAAVEELRGEVQKWSL